MAEVATTRKTIVHLGRTADLRLGFQVFRASCAKNVFSAKNKDIMQRTADAPLRWTRRRLHFNRETDASDAQDQTTRREFAEPPFVARTAMEDMPLRCAVQEKLTKN